MNCENCQELLSDYLDGSLPGGERARAGEHLAACAECSVAFAELKEIVGVAHECREELFEPPDARAMWLRISNVVEGERALRPAAAAPARPRASLWARLFNKRWELTLPQMAAAVSAVAVSVALVTAVGVQGLRDAASPGSDDARQTTKLQGRASGEGVYPNAFVSQQQARISYLQQRVDQRKASWNPRLRDSFERSLNVLDQAMLESLQELERNPHDEVSEEMLNSALRDKMELLREFSGQ